MAAFGDKADIAEPDLATSYLPVELATMPQAHGRSNNRGNATFSTGESDVA